MYIEKNSYFCKEFNKKVYKKAKKLIKIIIMENYTEEQVQKMSLSEVVNLLNEQKSQIDMYREASEYRGQQFKAINEKINIIKSIINL